MIKVMFNILIILLSIGVCLSSAQWMPYLEPQNMSPFPHSMADQMIVPKDSSNKIPIILLLKPKRAKGLRADTSAENVELHPSEAQHPMSINEWMEMPHIDSDSMVSPQTNVNQYMSASDYGMSVEPDSEASEDDEVSIKSRGGEQIKWPQALIGKKNGVTAEQLASISHLFPKLAAMSASNTDLGEVNNKNTGALFEDALKKFTSNLTDLEHRNNEDSDKSSEEEEVTENSSESSIDTQSSGISDVVKSTQTENNENNSENTNEKKVSFSAEQREGYERLSPLKSRPFINERNRIKIPIKSELNEKKTDPVIQTIVGQPSHKGWVPLKNKPLKPKRKSSKPNIHKIEAHPMHFPSEPSPMSGQYLYHNSDRMHFGMPEQLNSIQSAESPPHLFRPRHFPHSYIPFDTKHTISHLPYHKYSSYLTETELTPTIMEMTADANKPQHLEPGKMGEEAALGADKVKDVIDEKEGMIDNKHVVDEKHMIVDEKQPMHGLGGEELLGQHMTCCDILHGQHNGHHHVIHDEVIKPDFDDDKVVHNFGAPEPFHHKHNEYPVHFGSKFGYFPHSFNENKKECHHSFPSKYPTTYWPPQVYRRPVYRPKLFYKPLFFG